MENRGGDGGLTSGTTGVDTNFHEAFNPIRDAIA